MITIEDVAREAGGFGGVGFAGHVGGRGRSAPKTRAAVLAAAEKLGYQTNYFASALRRRSTSTIGMVVPHIANPFFIELVEKVENHVQGHGFDIFLCDSQNDPAIEAQRIRALMARQVDGIVLICADEVESRNSVLTAKDQVPVIVLDREIREIALDRIAVDNESGIKMIVEHLVRAGSRRLAFVGANERISTAHDRLQAYRKAVDAVGVGSRDDVMLGAFSVEWGREAGLAIAKRAERPDAVVCANDLIAVGVMRGLKGQRPAHPGRRGGDRFRRYRAVPLCRSGNHHHPPTHRCHRPGGGGYPDGAHPGGSGHGAEPAARAGTGHPEFEPPGGVGRTPHPFPIR